MQSNHGLQVSPPGLSIQLPKPPNPPKQLTVTSSKRWKLDKIDAHIFLDHVQYNYLNGNPEVFANFLGIFDLLNKDW
jgi:hypothetical protein